jgi:F-type H+-transporting ATPase subunit delta
LKDVTVAGRYARGLFILTEKRSETARALEDLHGLTGILKPGTPVGDFLAYPGLRLQEKRGLLERAFGGRVIRSVAVFVDLLLRKHRLREFPTIVEEFEALVEKALGVRRAHVVSAVPLEPAETKKLHDALEKHWQTHIKLTSEVDPALLGGALVRLGDTVVDRSVRTLLESVAEQLHEARV